MTTDSNLTPDTPESWSAASRGYAEEVAPVLMRPFMDEMVDRLGVTSSSRVLEVGAGSGALTETLAARVGSLLSTDFAPKMIEVSRERSRARGETNIEFEVMDGQALALADDGFDAAASSFAMMLFPDRVKGFAELRRVVRSGGKIVASGWAGPDRFEFFALMLGAMRRAFPDLERPEDPPVFRLADPAVFRADMEAGGLTDVSVEFVVREMEVADVEQLWRAFSVGAPPVQALVDKVGPAGAEKLRGALRDLVTEKYGDGPIRTTNTATVGVGVVP